MAHGDNKGLQLPPKLAPSQVVVIPIIPSDEHKSSIMNSVNEINDSVKSKFRVKIDDRENLSPGFKFNEWELKGVPLRIEIGPKDIEKGSVVFSRRDGIGGKYSVPISDIDKTIQTVLDEIQVNMLHSSKQHQEENTIHVSSKKELIEALNSNPGFVTCYWNEDSDDENEIKEITKATLRCYLLDSTESEISVNNSNEKGKLAVFSKAY